jgi:predicted branched-subunit amino acid permease
MRPPALTLLRGRGKAPQSFTASMSLPRPPLTLAGLLLGARLTLPLLPGIAVFASAFGAAAAQKGMTFAEAVFMSAIVYAGASQMVALELWRETWSPSTILAIATVTAVVNARMVLMGAALQPWLAGAPTPRNVVNLFFLTDANWLLGMRYRAEGGNDHGMLLGAGLALWLIWIGATIPGYLAGALVPEPRRYGLDLVMPVFFSAMLVPLWKGPRLALPWAVAGLVALATQALVPGYSFIITGALAGMLAGLFVDD